MDFYSTVYGLLIIGVGIVLGIILFRVTYKLTSTFASEARRKSLGRVVQWLTVILFLLIGGLTIFGANSTSIAFIMGALTFALTFGLQNVIQNFVAGLLMAIDGRIQIGQWVEIGDQPKQMGPAEVLDISLQKVKLRESGGYVYFIPNSYINMHKLLNYSVNGYVEVQVQITLPHQENIETAEQVLVDVAKESRNVYPQKQRSSKDMSRRPSKVGRMSGAVTFEVPPERILPIVRQVKASKDGIDYVVSMWTPFPERRDEIATDYLRRSIKALKAAQINLKDVVSL
jgi:small-conductance mechanosensitive channel